MRNNSLSRITVRRRPGNPSQGWLVAGPLALPVALGRGGIKANKREGDGGTPRGTFRLRRLWWRGRPACPARRPRCRSRRIKADDGWCEDPSDRHYNQPVKVPPGSQRRPADARRSSLRLHHRARSQHPAAHRRPRQRRVHPCRPAAIRADRRLRRARHRCVAPAARRASGRAPESWLSKR